MHDRGEPQAIRATQTTCVICNKIIMSHVFREKLSVFFIFSCFFFICTDSSLPFICPINISFIDVEEKEKLIFDHPLT